MKTKKQLIDFEHKGNEKHSFKLRPTLLSLCMLTFIGGYSQTGQVNLNLKNATVKELFREIEKQTSYRFSYRDIEINNKGGITISGQGKELKEVLTNELAKQQLSYTVSGNKIIVSPISQNKTSKERKNVSGKVVDTKGNPIIGATIMEKGTTNGTITDYDGNFIIEVPENALLSISYIGYEPTLTKAIYGKTLSITIKEDSKMLDEIVVTALGIKRDEKALGYSVQKIGGDKIQTIKSLDMGTALTGKISGLMVKNSSDFSSAPNITLRGENPLLVIDGVPYGNMSLRDISNDDIESIDVLKGATASALYGYRGASGAIMVTTKKGSKDKGLSVSVNSSSMFTAGYLAIPEIQTTFGRVIANTETNEYSRTLPGCWGVPMDGREVVQWDPISKTMRSMPYLPIGKNNLKNFLENGWIINNNISVVQQGQYGSLRTSATWVNNKGTYPNSIFNKYTFSIGGDMKLNKFTLSSNFTYNKQTSPNIGFNSYRGYDPMYSLLLLSAPDFDIRQYKDYWLIPGEVQNNSYTTSHNNPYFDMYERIHTYDRDILNGYLSLNYEIAPWLKAMTRLGFDTYTNSQDVRISQGSNTNAGTATVVGGGKEIWGENIKGSFNTGLSRGYSINGDFILSGEKSFNNFNIDALVGGTIYYTNYNAIEALTRDGLTVPGFYSIKASISPIYTNTHRNKRQVNSIYGKFGASWKDMLFLDATLRNDWSSTLPEETRSYLYPSLAGSFLVSELLPKNNILSLWKIRGSWTTSKTPAGIYEINKVYAITQNAWGNMTSASLPSSLRSSLIQPQTSQAIEFGTMFNFFNNRMSLDFTYFSKRMYDFIVSASVSPASGYSSKYINSEEEKTRNGVEISAMFVPVKTKDFEWNLTGNWSKSVSKFTKLDDKYSNKAPWIQIGARTDVLAGNDYLRNPETNEIIHVNGIPQYSSYKSVLGYNDPNWIWGLTTSLRYKNWTFKMSMDGRVGGVTPSFTESYMWRNGAHPESVTEARYKDVTIGGSNYTGTGVKVISGDVKYDPWGKILEDTRKYAPNDIPVTYKAYTEALHRNFAWGGTASPVDILSTTFMKIREISITYKVPYEFCKKLKAKDIALSLIGNNIFMWAKDFKYSDPDGGTENLSDPSLRYLGFNVQLNF